MNMIVKSHIDEALGAPIDQASDRNCTALKPSYLNRCGIICSKFISLISLPENRVVVEV